MILYVCDIYPAIFWGRLSEKMGALWMTSVSLNPPLVAILNAIARHKHNQRSSFCFITRGLIDRGLIAMRSYYGTVLLAAVLLTAVLLPAVVLTAVLLLCGLITGRSY